MGFEFREEPTTEVHEPVDAGDLFHVPTIEQIAAYLSAEPVVALRESSQGSAVGRKTRICRPSARSADYTPAAADMILSPHVMLLRQ